MTFLQALILGLVQGVAEFLPISSSGHLVLLQHLFGMPEVDDLYNILLHFATLAAVVAAYWKDVVKMVLEFFRGLAVVFGPKGSGGRRPPAARRLVLLVIVATLPLAVVLPLHDLISKLDGQPVIVACALIATGFLLFFADRTARGRKTERSATVKDALLVGLAQACATVPGLSRSGCTISAGMALGFKRRFAVRFSFLLSLPAVLGATVVKVVKAVKAGGVDPAMLPKYIAGMVVAAVVGYFSIQVVKLLSEKGRFGRFAYYCWAAGLASLILLFVLK